MKDIPKKVRVKLQQEEDFLPLCEALVENFAEQDLSTQDSFAEYVHQVNSHFFTKKEELHLHFSKGYAVLLNEIKNSGDYGNT